MLCTDVNGSPLFLISKHLFVDIRELSFCNLRLLLVVVFINVYVKVTYFLLGVRMSTSIEPIGYGVCYMYVGCEEGFIAGSSK